MPKPKLTTARYADRFFAEAERQQRRYCDAFAQWRSCAKAQCRRERACRGDARSCLRRALDSVPRDVQHRAREDILKAIPATLGGPERAARLCTARDFLDGGDDACVIGEMKRLRKVGKLIAGGDNAHTLRLRVGDA
jgi:hypothetical protein